MFTCTQAYSVRTGNETIRLTATEQSIKWNDQYYIITIISLPKATVHDNHNL